MYFIISYFPFISFYHKVFLYGLFRYVRSLLIEFFIWLFCMSVSMSFSVYLFIRLVIYNFRCVVLSFVIP